MVKNSGVRKRKNRKYKKSEKKRIIAIVLFIIAFIQIFNFARLNVGVFPEFYLDFQGMSLFEFTKANLNWPFKIINYYLYFLFGWAGLLTPLVLSAIAWTLFEPRETDKVRRKRIIILWAVLEIVFLVYIINYISFIIAPGLRPGYIVSEIFARYLRKVGGFAFITLFFIWSFISYILFVVKSDWHRFFIVSWKFIKTAMVKSLELFLYLLSFKTSDKKVGKKSVNQKKITDKTIKKSNQKRITSEVGDRFNVDQETPEISKADKTGLGKVSEKYDSDSGSLSDDSIKNKFLNSKTEENTIDVPFEKHLINEIDTTTLDYAFDYDSLIESKKGEEDEEYIMKLADNIEKNLLRFGINVKRSGLTLGPRMIRFEYDFPNDISLKEIIKHQEELSHRMGGVNLTIEMPIPGTERFGIYCEREYPDLLGFGDYLNADNLNNKSSEGHEIPLFLGVAPDGKALWHDATTFPHLMVSGTTGSGKSVFLNNIILNLVAFSKESPVNMILIDPKRVEFAPYRNLKQLSTPIITDTDDARTVLKEAEDLMEDRYSRITDSAVRNICEYNKTSEVSMPYIFIIIDEFADLVMQDKSGEIKKSVIRLAQKSRAVGIHVIIATQRPSSDVIDGLIKANFPARVAFKVSGKVDSRIILDENGAEELLGKGDMICKISSDLKYRLQGVYVSIDEIKSIVSED